VLGFRSAFVPAGKPSTIDLDVEKITPGPTPPKPDDNDDDDKFPTWAIIVICVVGGVLIIGTIGLCYYKKR